MLSAGEVAEWSNVPDSKSGVVATSPWVRIPPSPPGLVASLFCGAIFLLSVLSVLSSLGEGVVDGLLILEYQKSSPTHHTLTQLRKAVLVLKNFRLPKVE
jgi:hypothetical protein